MFCDHDDSSNLPTAVVVLLTAVAAIAGREPPNGTPPQPPAGAANGPQPRASVEGPGASERTGEASPTKPSARQKSPGEFLVIGAPADPEAAARGKAIFVAKLRLLPWQ